MATEQTSQTARPSILTPDIAVVREPDSPTAQSYRAVRESLRHARTDQPVRSVLLADAGSKDQAGEAVANLGASFALNGDSAVVVDACAGNPSLHTLLNTPLSPGLVEWLSAGRDDQRPQPIETAVEGLSVLPAGTRTEAVNRAVADMLTERACERLSGELGLMARYVLFHAPPLPASSEALTIAANVDAVLLVIRAGSTRRSDAQRAKELLERVGANILGAVLTDVR